RVDCTLDCPQGSSAAAACGPVQCDGGADAASVTDARTGSPGDASEDASAVAAEADQSIDAQPSAMPSTSSASARGCSCGVVGPVARIDEAFAWMLAVLGSLSWLVRAGFGRGVTPSCRTARPASPGSMDAS